MATLRSLVNARRQRLLNDVPVRRAPPSRTTSRPVQITIDGRGGSGTSNLAAAFTPTVVSDFMSDNRGERDLINRVHDRALEVGRAGEQRAQSRVPVATGRLKRSLTWTDPFGPDVLIYSSPLVYHPIQEDRVGYISEAVDSAESALPGNFSVRFSGWVTVQLGQTLAVTQGEVVETFNYSRFLDVAYRDSGLVVRFL